MVTYQEQIIYNFVKLLEKYYSKNYRIKNII